MTLRADESQYLTLKIVSEQLLGRKAWYDLKECTSLVVWKKYVTKLLRAMELAVQETVQVRDDLWFEEFSDYVQRGLELARKSKSIDELFSGLSATLLRISFLQIGFFPNQSKSQKVSLRRADWRLSRFRTVQYVQSAEQLEDLFWSKQQGELGVQDQMAVWEHYRTSKSKIRYSEWCGLQSRTLKTVNDRGALPNKGNCKRIEILRRKRPASG